VPISGRMRWLLRGGTFLALAFLYVPILVVILYAFNSRRIQTWPIKGLTFEWFGKALDNSGARDALWMSLKAGLGATIAALVLGTLAAMAVSRRRFFGRDSVSFLIILPLALPGIVTGMALNATFREVFHIELGLLTIIIGHATFCIVVVYNNTAARLRRLSPSMVEAAQDLGAGMGRSFRDVTLPLMRSALAAGGLLAFALSFDEIIVTTFTVGGDQTLPIWIQTNVSRPNQLPIVNVVAVFAILLSLIPVYLAHRLTREEGTVTGGAAGAGAAARQ
jgi:putative spermidine/putrescine transport system permease protein